jgi:hypothetical protein
MFAIVWSAAILIATGAAIYWFMVRPVLAQWAAFKPFYATLNTVEATWWFRVRMSVKGLKVRLLNMAVIIATFTLTLAEWVGASGGLISYLPSIHLGASDIPAAVYIPMLATVLTSVANMVLRKYATTTPDGSPVPETPAAVDVPTVPGKPDAVIETVGTAVSAVNEKPAS